MGGFLAIFPLEMGLYFADHSQISLPFLQMGIKFRIFFSKPEYSMPKLHQTTKASSLIPKFFLEMGTFSRKWVLTPQISFLEMGASWISWAAHPCHPADLVPPPTPTPREYATISSKE